MSSATRHTVRSLAWTPANHFRLWFFETVARLRGSWPHAEQELPFLAGYYDELDAGADAGVKAFASTRAAWERAAPPGRLPLRELALRSRLDDDAIGLLFAIGLIEEDHRFATLFEVLQGSGRTRPTLGLLNSWIEGCDARTIVPRLLGLGLVEIMNPAEPRMTWALQVAAPVWDAMRGASVQSDAGRLRCREARELAPLDDLILAAETRAAARAVAPLVAEGTISCVTVRGPQASGRATLAAAIARELGRGLVELETPPVDDPLVRFLAPLAVLLGSLPLITLDLGPAETFPLPPVLGSLGPVAVAVGVNGGLAGACMERAVELTVDLPAPAERRRHWESTLDQQPDADLRELAGRHRMTGGNIRRTATLARAEAALAGADHPSADHVRRAARTRSGQLLDSLAQRVPTVEDWGGLALADETKTELALLELRCRHRERLGEHVGGALSADLGAGVRALFCGPSGTGKTLAARTLAGVLDVDLYRLDLSMIVDKYIGETEKNLSRIFARAEEADIALLLDEGDSLLTKRTSVESSHDRYANLETNYLLQRLESYQGILLVTTNAGERIDGAFRRRMDVVVDFYTPEALERWAIWQLHLPEQHCISASALEQASARCAMTGGQIRNAVLHAAVLAMAAGGKICDHDLAASIQREYRKAGQVCPLPGATRG